jgi:hypothetical protein
MGVNNDKIVVGRATRIKTCLASGVAKLDVKAQGFQ